MHERPWLHSYPARVRWRAPLPTGLAALGVAPGCHVALLLPNTLHFPIAFFAVMRLGGVIVALSPLDPERVLRHKIEDGHADVLVTIDAAGLAATADALLGSSRLRALVVGSLADLPGGADATPAVSVRGARRCAFAELLANDGAYVRPAAPDAATAIAAIQYTGGTTGLPKGAVLTHANLTSLCSQLVEVCAGAPPVLEPGRECLLIALPLFHIYGLGVNLLFGVRLAARLVLHARFDPDAVLADVATRGVTVLCGVPTMFQALLAHPQAARLGSAQLKFCNSGGAPAPVEVLQRIVAATRCRILEGWAMTETAGAGTFTPIDGAHKPGSCGIPVPGLDLKLVDVTDGARVVARGERGEVCVRGPNVTPGYFGHDVAADGVYTADGYLRTGDVGYLDADGYLYLIDRTKDMLLCSGYNVYPRTIEEAVYEHPAVAECCVIGIPDAYRGQAPKAFVVLRPGVAGLGLAELQAFLAPRLGRHEIVAALELRATLPRTPVGKLSKQALYAEEAARAAAPPV